MKHVFGPVPSRRLGRSLGVDLVPFKVCSYDCIYCQVGRTTRKTPERKEFVPAAEILKELREALSRPDLPDFVTMSGSGEPTLNSAIGTVIRGVKQVSGVKTAVLTNGSLLWMEDVRRDISAADVVLPTLVSTDEEKFRRIHRPAPGLSLGKILEGFRLFRDEFRGEIWLEVFIVKGINDSPEDIRNMRRTAEEFRPDKVQLNTAVRPASEKSAEMVPEDLMRRLAEEWGPPAEIIASFPVKEHPAFEKSREDVLEMLRRRPCTIEDIASGLHIHPNEASKYVGELFEAGLVSTETRNGRKYYLAR